MVECKATFVGGVSILLFAVVDTESDLVIAVVDEKKLVKRGDTKNLVSLVTSGDTTIIEIVDHEADVFLFSESAEPGLNSGLQVDEFGFGNFISVGRSKWFLGRGRAGCSGRCVWCRRIAKLLFDTAANFKADSNNSNTGEDSCCNYDSINNTAAFAIHYLTGLALRRRWRNLVASAAGMRVV